MVEEGRERKRRGHWTCPNLFTCSKTLKFGGGGRREEEGKYSIEYGDLNILLSSESPCKISPPPLFFSFEAEYTVPILYYNSYKPDKC
jgi:hypothetical protein